MKIIFMGTPAFAVPSLKALIESHEVVAVCTQPDRPAGRGHKLQPSPVKIVAEEYGIPVLQPETLKKWGAARCDEGTEPCANEARSRLKAFGADAFVVAAYGLLLPKGVLNMPPHGCINVHASLLPKYRGASPIHAALLNGDAETGITIMHMDVGIDTGDIVLAKSIPIIESDRLPTLHDKLAELGGDLILEALSQIENGTATRTPQDEAKSTYAPLIQKTDGHISWSSPTAQIINQCRALDPWPGCYAVYENQPLKIWAVKGIQGLSLKSFNIESASPGTILAADHTNGIIIKTGDGAALITELQAHGAKRMPATDYLRGRKLSAGEVLL
ncbi:MAG: methionyl-tRNA formyltransferase [Defluviitaleaceae bacterium]|nr:methionyl-tRNA formyltransferase [Defluviitaleaceae bacterium]